MILAGFLLIFSFSSWSNAEEGANFIVKPDKPIYLAQDTKAEDTKAEDTKAEDTKAEDTKQDPSTDSQSLQSHEHSSNVTHQSSKEDIARQLSNPVSLLWSINLQNNWTFNKGKLSNGKYKDFYKFDFQPVLPFLLTEKIKVINRLDLPILGGKPVFSPGKMGFDNDSGLGDITFFSLFSPNTKPTKGKPYEIIMGIGPTFIFPSATKDSLGQGKWQFGPTGVLGYLDKNWVIAALVQQWWSYAGDSDRDKTSQMAIQYFVWRMLPGAWQVGTGTPTINIDWKAPDNDDKVNLPIGLAIGKTITIGKMPLKIELQGSYSVVNEDTFGERWNIQLILTPVIPSLIKNAIF
jgi:hypothetical protein